MEGGGLGPVFFFWGGKAIQCQIFPNCFVNKIRSCLFKSLLQILSSLQFQYQSIYFNEPCVVFSQEEVWCTCLKSDLHKIMKQQRATFSESELRLSNTELMQVLFPKMSASQTADWSEGWFFIRDNNFCVSSGPFIHLEREMMAWFLTLVSLSLKDGITLSIFDFSSPSFHTSSSLTSPFF